MPEFTSALQSTLKSIETLLEKVQDPVEDTWDPIELGLLLSKLEYEEIDVPGELEAFNKLTADFGKEISPQSTLRTQSETVIRLFAENLSFEGDHSNYYNLKNSFLHDVLLRRKGIPITLALVFIGIAQRVGVRAVGVSFPGHFLVKVLPQPGYMERMDNPEDVEDWRSHFYIDVFDKGKILSIDDCEKRLYEWTRGVIPFGPEVLQVAHPREMISRILRNIRAIVAEKEDLARLYWVLTALIELCPDDKIEAQMERGFLFARTGRFGQAVSDLKSFLELSTDLNKRTHVEQMLRYFEQQIEVTN